MDFLKNMTGSSGSSSESQNPSGATAEGTSGNGNSNSSSGSFMSGMSDKLNSAAGGGKASEKNEDMLDKGVDFVQQYAMGQGAQDNESAIEQAKDEQISDFIRGQYKSNTGSDFPVADK